MLQTNASAATIYLEDGVDDDLQKPAWEQPQFETEAQNFTEDIKCLVAGIQQEAAPQFDVF